MTKIVNINQEQHDVITNLLADHLEDVMRVLGHNHNIDDVEWQVVYDIKSHILDELTKFGLEIKD